MWQRNKFVLDNVTNKEETDIEMVSLEVISNEAVLPIATEGTEFLMEPKEANGHWRRVSRAKNTVSEGRTV